MEAKDVLTLFIAAIGATLGVVNFFIDRWRNRVRLQITLEHGVMERQTDVPVLRLVNKSPFPLHIERVVVSRVKAMSPGFHVDVIERKRFISMPITMEPRTASALLIAPIAAHPDDLADIRWIGVASECGYEGFATGPALKIIHQQATPTARLDAFAKLVHECGHLVIRAVDAPVKTLKQI